jgi:hypothetical protein
MPSTIPAMEVTDELLISLIARLIKVEATSCTFGLLALHQLAEPHPRHSFDALTNICADFRARYIHNQIESFAVQFPQFAKQLHDHALVSESDLKEFLYEILRET